MSFETFGSEVFCNAVTSDDFMFYVYYFNNIVSCFLVSAFVFFRPVSFSSCFCLVTFTYYHVECRSLYFVMFV